MADRIGDFEFTSPVPLYYSDLFDPKAFDERAVPKYTMRIILPNGDPQLKALVALATKVAKEDKVKMVNSPFKSGDEILQARKDQDKETSEDMRDLLTNAVVFKATTGAKYPPNLYVPGPAGPVKTQSPDKFYIGALVIPVVSLRSYTGMGGGVNAYFNALFSTGKGDRVGGGGSGGPKASWMQFADPEPTGGLWALETALKEQLQAVPPKIKKQLQDASLNPIDDDIPF